VGVVCNVAVLLQLALFEDHLPERRKRIRGLVTVSIAAALLVRVGARVDPGVLLLRQRARAPTQPTAARSALAVVVVVVVVGLCRGCPALAVLLRG
jgi:hypothetical protein